MANVKIRISKTSPEQEEQERVPSKAQETARTAAISAFSQMAINSAKSLVNNAISHTGEWTGDYLKESRLNITMQALMNAATWGAALVSSVAMSNPMPLITKAFSSATEYGQTFYNDFRYQQKSQRDSDFLLARSGNGTVNGSRGTEN